MASIFIATSIVGFDSQVANACSTGGSSSSGLSHGSSLGSGSVTVCVGSSNSSSGSTQTHKTVRQVVTPAPQAPVVSTPKPSPKPSQSPVASKVTSCPTAAQLANLPRSADAAARWVQSICPKPINVVVAPKPVPKSNPQITNLTETLTVRAPGVSSMQADSVKFYPTPLRASVQPRGSLLVGELANFTSNPTVHYRIATLLSRQAQVHFVPVASGWSFSDGIKVSGARTARSFPAAGTYRAVAWVKYKVSYRLAGETTWQPVSGRLRLVSNRLRVIVGVAQDELLQDFKGALLVGQDCTPNSGAFGCNN